MTAESRGTSVGTALTVFLVGVIAGVVGTVIIPKLVRPYLPESMVGTDELVYGVVTGKRLEADRLLLTLPTAGGTVLATFTHDMAEIDLMVGVGDSLTFGMDRYEPFVTNPTIARVVTLSSPLTGSPRPNMTTDSMRVDSSASPEIPPVPTSDSLRSQDSSSQRPETAN